LVTDCLGGLNPDRERVEGWFSINETEQCQEIVGHGVGEALKEKDSRVVMDV